MEIGYKYFVLFAIFLYRERQFNLIGEIKSLFNRRFSPHCFFELLCEICPSYNGDFETINEKWKNFIMKIYYNDTTKYMESIGLNQHMTYKIFKKAVHNSLLLYHLKIPSTMSLNDFIDGFYNFKNER